MVIVLSVLSLVLKNRKKMKLYNQYKETYQKFQVFSYNDLKVMIQYVV